VRARIAFALPVLLLLPVAPPVAGDLLLVGSCSGIFYALDKRTGEPLWSYDTALDGEPAEFHGDPAVLGDRVVTSCDRTSLAHTYAFRLDTGEVAWKQPRAALFSDVAGLGRLAVGRRWNGDLIVLDSAHGDIRWSVGPSDYTYRHGPDLSPVERDGVLYFGGVDGHVYAVDGAGSDVRWSTDLHDAFTTSPATDGVDLYIGVAGHRVYRLDAATGETVWALALP